MLQAQTSLMVPLFKCKDLFNIYCFTWLNLFRYSYDCNGTNAQKWVIKKGQTKVKVAGQNFCLDAGSNPASGVKSKIWQCYDGLPAQDYWYTDDNRIAVTGKGQCLDLTDGGK